MKTFPFVCLLLCGLQASATHLRGGYIQAKPVSASSYEITVTLFYDEYSGTQASNDANELNLCFGDGTTRIVTRQNRTLFNDRALSANVYRMVYTYAGPGTYTVSVSMPNRTPSRNIRQADQTPMLLSTRLVVNNAGTNQTPTISVAPGSFRAAVNQPYSLSLSGVDADGDSLVYTLQRSLTNPASRVCEPQSVLTYQYPNDLTRQGTYKINSRTGVLNWDAPVEEGNYNVVVSVGEYRNGVLLSQTLVELAITVTDQPGTAKPLPPYEPAVEGALLVTALPEYRDEGVLFTVFPNPVDDRLQVVIQTNRVGPATVQLFDQTGRKLRELTMRQLAQRHEQLIGMENLPPGQYIIRANAGGRIAEQKVVKK